MPLTESLEPTASVGRKDSTFGGKVRGCAMGMRVKEFHQGYCCLDRGLGVVGDIEGDQSVGKAHDAQANLPCAVRHAADVVKGRTVVIDHMVEEAHGERNDAG